MRELAEQPYSLALLEQAWDRVRRGNPEPGVDRVSVKRFQRGVRKRLRSLCSALNSCRYVPEAARGVQIRKSDGSTRLLMLPSIRDRVAQAATVALLEPEWEPRFLNCSYAYRPGKGHHKALGRVEHLLRSGRKWVAKADIDDFFSSIRHEILLRQLADCGASRPVLHVVELWLRMGYIGQMGLEVQEIGIPQGSIISPLLANIYLHVFDVALRMKHFEHVRYADDYVILCASRREAEEAYAFAARFLESELQLKLNEGAGGCCVSLHQGFTFLGLEFRGNKRRIAATKMEKAKNKLREIGRRLQDASAEQLVAALNITVRAWQYYYQRCNDEECFRELDDTLEQVLVDWSRTRGRRIGRAETHAIVSLERLSFRNARARVRANRELLGDMRAVVGQKAAGERRVPRSRKVETDVARVIEGRRRHYNRRVAGGSSLVVVRSGSTVGVCGDEVRVRWKGTVVYTGRLRTVRHIVLADKRVSVSSDLISRCAEHGIGVETVDFGGRTIAVLTSPYYGDPHLWEAQLAARRGKKGRVIARAFVVAKLENQLRLLKYLDKYWRKKDPVLHRLFLGESETMLRAIGNAKRLSVDVVDDISEWSNRMRGFEGIAAASYWAVVARDLPAVSGFTGRRHRAADDPVNQMLNYGYGVLYGRAHAALSAAGLNPHWGFLHRGAKTRGLVYDFVEMFRPWAVDRVVLASVKRGEPAEVASGRLTDETRRRLLGNVLERLARSARYRGERLSLEVVMYRQAQELAEFISGERRSYKPFLAHW